MNLFVSLTDTELKARFDELVTARQQLTGGEGIAVIAGEGRRIEYTRSDSSSINVDLRNILAEAASRGLDWGKGANHAIRVEIG